MASNKQEWLDAFKHLRLHFSLLLMPVFLFALTASFDTNYFNLLSYDSKLLCSMTKVFFILHLLVYPSSNAFNSFNDRDSGSIGALKNPPPKNIKMLWLSNLLDFLAICLAASLNIIFAALIVSYIAASRLYSHREIRLKKYPIVGFLVIFTFQGALVYFATFFGIFHSPNLSGIQIEWSRFFTLEHILKDIYGSLATSFQIGAIYPLTQIYQHESDLADGVTTLSYKLGYKGTFIFAGIMFAIATLFYFLHFRLTDINTFYLFTIVQIPIIGYFVYWASKVWKDTKYADYKHTMQMNVIAAVILNLFFFYLVLT